MYQTKNLGLNVTEMPKDTLMPWSFHTDLGYNFEAIDEKTLSHRNITNCLLEVPQNIKLELSDGTLTLKEGSKVYIPNGFEADGTTPKFDELIVNEDILLSDTSGIANGKQGLFYIDTESAIHYYDLSIVFSGSTAPSTSAVWYDTVNNKIIESRDGGVTWEKQGCLPLCIFTSNGTNIASIDQTFNGFGYMGSTVFVLPGVKGLIPNGRNEDGTFNNIEYTVPSVICKDFLEEGHTGPAWYIVGDNNTLVNSGQGYYISKDGYLIDKWSGVVTRALVFAEGNRESGVITSFTPRKPFQAVDYNDYQTKITELEAKIEALQAAVEALQG